MHRLNRPEFFSEERAKPLNFIDSIGILSLILSLVVVVLTPPLWLKILLLIASILGSYTFALRSHWTHRWPLEYRYGLATLAAVILLAVAIPQLMAQWKVEHPAVPDKVDTQAASVIPESFTARVEFILDREPGLFFWTLNGNYAVCPASVAMFVDLTNLQKSFAMISTFTVEAMNADGAWVKLPQLPTPPGIDVYVQNIPPPNNAAEVLVERFDQLLLNHNFGPNETVRGWAFFDNSLGARFYYVRVTVTDFTGNHYTSPALTLQAASGQDVTLHVTGKRKNLTKLKLLDHCG
jgi:hypothetical protein